MLVHRVTPQIAPTIGREHATAGAVMASRCRNFRFGPFLLQPERQQLLMFDTPVRIGGRALDLLTLLVERAGELVSKHELISRAWPETFVDASNLKVNIRGLRQALGEEFAAPRFIATVVGRGYRFIAPVEAWPNRSDLSCADARWPKD